MKTLTAISIALLLLAFSASAVPAGEAAAGAIKIGEEVTLMSDGPGRTMRSLPAVAFGPSTGSGQGKDVFLVAWQEGWQGEGGSSRIYVARVGLDGKMLDPKGIELAPAKTGIQEYPRVAFFGGVFLVVWNDMRNGKDCDVLGARVSPEGKVLDAQPIAIAAGPRTQAMPDVAADEEGFMVVWHGFVDKEIFPQVFAARVGADGAADAPVALLPVASSCPLIAWNGKEHLLLFTKTSGRIRQTTAVRMDTAGKVLAGSPQRIFNGAYRTSVCGVSGDKGWLMAHHEGSPNWWNRGVGIQRVVVVTPDGKKEAPGDDKGQYAPKGGVVPPNWLDTSYGKGGRSNVGGSANTPKVFPYGGNAVAADRKYCVAVWQRYQMGGATGMQMVNGDILSSRVDGCVVLDKDGVPVADSAANERNPALAGNGAGKLLCVYEKIVDGKTSITARTLRTR